GGRSDRQQLPAAAGREGRPEGLTGGGQAALLSLRRASTPWARLSSVFTVVSQSMQPSVTLLPYSSGLPGTRSWRPAARKLSIITPQMRVLPAAICAAMSAHTAGWFSGFLLLLPGLASTITRGARPAASSCSQIAATLTAS